MSQTASRRAFLGGLSALPAACLSALPTSAAEVPAELVPQLLDSYDTFLCRERDALLWERYGANPPKDDNTRLGPWIALYDLRSKQPFRLTWADNPAMPWICDAPPASTRAVLVLDTIGIDWRRQGPRSICL